MQWLIWYKIRLNRTYSNFQVFQLSNPSCGDRSKPANYNWYLSKLHVQQICLFPWNVQVRLSFRIIWFSSALSQQSPLKGTFPHFFFSFLLIITRSGRWSVRISKSPGILCFSFSRLSTLRINFQGSTSPPSRVQFCTSFELVYHIRLLCD